MSGALPNFEIFTSTFTNPNKSDNLEQKKNIRN